MSDTTTANIRDTLEASYEVLEESANQGTTDEGIVEVPPANDPPAADTNTPPEGENSSEAQEKAAREYNRDEAGKFAKAEAEKAAKELGKVQEKQEMTPGPKAGQPKDHTERAPQAWKPAAREHWAKIPAEARQEIARREQEVQVALQQSAESRRYAEAIQKTLAPYQHFIKAEGGTDFAAIDSMMAAAAKLRTGTAPELASFVSQIINQYGVGRFGPQFIQALDQSLSGMAPQQVDPQLAAMQQRMEAEMAPFRQWQQQQAYAAQQSEMEMNYQASSEVQNFAQEHEFLNDVRMEMADIIDMGAARGINYTLDQAYEIACRAHPEISRVMQQREEAKIAQRMTQTAQTAKRAAVSVGGSPAVGGGNEQGGGSIRDAIQFAMYQNSR